MLVAASLAVKRARRVSRRASRRGLVPWAPGVARPRRSSWPWRAARPAPPARPARLQRCRPRARASGLALAACVGRAAPRRGSRPRLVLASRGPGARDGWRAPHRDLRCPRRPSPWCPGARRGSAASERGRRCGRGSIPRHVAVPRELRVQGARREAPDARRGKVGPVSAASHPAGRDAAAVPCRGTASTGPGLARPAARRPRPPAATTAGRPPTRRPRRRSRQASRA